MTNTLLPAGVLCEIEVPVHFDKGDWPEFMARLIDTGIHEVAENVGGIFYRFLEKSPATEIPVALPLSRKFKSSLAAYPQ